MSSCPPLGALAYLFFVVGVPVTALLYVFGALIAGT